MAEFEVELPDLAPFQQEWIDAIERFVCVEGATGTGKTYVFEPELFRLAHEPKNPGDEYWWISPTLAQARAVFDDIYRSLQEAEALAAYPVSKMPMSITTPEGGVMRFLTADNPEYFYGIRNVRYIIVDEFTRCRPSLWNALLTVANKTGARIILIGNYTGDTSAWHLWIKSMEGDPEFRYFRTTAMQAVEAGIMPKERMETARRTLPPAVFAALYLCQGVDDPSLLLDYGAVADLWSNEHVPEGDKCITADIALHGSDKFVMGVWSGFRLKEILTLEKRSAKEIEDILKGKATEHDVPRSRIVYDADGLGTYLKSYLQGAASYQGGMVAMPMQGQKLSYANLRAQCHFLTADAINARTMFFETPLHRAEIEQELYATMRSGYKDHSGVFHPGEDAAGRRTIVPKDHPEHGARVRLGRSPDLSDMIVMRQFLTFTQPGKLADSLKRGADQVKTIRFKRAQDKGNGLIPKGR